ncbi:MAG: cytochrome b/b6 domain-containing protein [Piscinibacter sp.]|nr:cytochrome b/b6 domain-containing protein [Piscinibacter sp.]
MTTSSPRAVLVWDAPVRVFHWLLVASFAGAWLTAESERWRLVHVTLGYTVGGLLLFRLLWGLIGTPPARFANFVRGPQAAWRYLRSLTGPRPEHHTGHNPAGALAIVALLLLIGVTVATGWAAYSELGGEWLEEWHEGAANALLAVVVVHLLGVFVGSWVHRENLVRSMLTGRKKAVPDAGIRRAHGALAAVLLAAVLGFWWLQWQSAPAAGAAQSEGVSAARAKHHDEDD